MWVVRDRSAQAEVNNIFWNHFVRTTKGADVDLQTRQSQHQARFPSMFVNIYFTKVNIAKNEQ